MTTSRCEVRLYEAYDLRIAERKLAGGADASLEIIAEKAKRPLEYFGARRAVESITSADLKAYASSARETRAIETVKREITELRCAIRAAGVEPPSAPELGTGAPKEIWLNSDESARLLRHVNPKRRDHVVIYRLAGLRYSELYRLEARDLRSTAEGRRLIRVRGTKSKTDARGGADRTVPIHPQVADIFERRAERARSTRCDMLFPDVWGENNGNRDLTLAARKAGLTWRGVLVGGQDGAHVTHNVLRASFCTELVLAGVPLKKVAYLMGHKNITMVERVYTRFLGEDVAADVTRLNHIESELEPEDD